MTLVTAKPVRKRKPAFYNSFDRMLDDFFRFDLPAGKEGTRTAARPAVNILEREEDFQLEFAVPGWEKSDFRIQVEEDLLTIEAEGKTEESSKAADDGVTYRRREFGRNGFKRSFRIPETVNTEAIDARYLNGILTLTLPKREEVKPEPVRTIEIG